MGRLFTEKGVFTRKRNTNLYVVSGVVFMPHPRFHGAWIKTDSSVVLAACNYCGAKKGQLCQGAGGGPRRTGTHSARRMDANRIRSRLRYKEKRRAKPLFTWYFDLSQLGEYMSHRGAKALKANQEKNRRRREARARNRRREARAGNRLEALGQSKYVSVHLVIHRKWWHVLMKKAAAAQGVRSTQQYAALVLEAAAAESARG